MFGNIWSTSHFSFWSTNYLPSFGGGGGGEQKKLCILCIQYNSDINKLRDEKGIMGSKGNGDVTKTVQVGYRSGMKGGRGHDRYSVWWLYAEVVSGKFTNCNTKSVVKSYSKNGPDLN